MSTAPGAPHTSPRGEALRSEAFWWRLTWLAVGASCALRLWLALDDHSIYWPDEIYQSLEQAHREAFGYGFVPWEFRDGARNWILPGMIAGLWRGAAALGVESSLVLVSLARGCVVLGSGASIWLAARLAERLASARAGFVAAVVLGLLPASVAFGYRAMSETVSAPLLVLGALCLTGKSVRSACLAGVWVTLAAWLRYQNALFGVAFVLQLLLERRHRATYMLCIAALATALAGGMLDWVTWGRPFHSLLTYVDFNLLRNGASTFGVEPFGYYVKSLWDSTGPALALLAPLALLGAWQAPALALSVLGYLLAHSLIPHKELRFLVPALPLGCVLVGIGADQLARRADKYVTFWWLGLSASALAMAFSLSRLTYRRMGQYLDTPRGARSVWSSDEETNLLLADAGKKPDLCGLGVLGLRPAFTGGYTYFHKPVPLLYRRQLCEAGPSVNYVMLPYYLVDSLLPAGYTEVEHRGWLALFRRDGDCAPLARAFDPLLDGAHDMGLHRPIAQQAQDESVHFDLLRQSGSFAQGWGNGELLDCRPARWATGHRSLVQFRAASPGKAYVLRAHLLADAEGPAQHLRVSLNGQTVYEGGLPTAPQLLVADVPALLRGLNELSFEFSETSQPGGDDTRELAALLGSLEITPLVDDFSVDVGTPSGAEHLRSGFSGGETAAGLSFAWSEGRASVVEGELAGPERGHLLSFTAQAIQGVSGRTQIWVNDHPVTNVEISPEWRRYDLLVGPQLLRLGLNRVRFEYDGTVVPAQLYPGTTDQRELAVRFDNVSLEALPDQSLMDFSAVENREALIDGWSEVEVEGPRSVVWSVGPRARLRTWLGGKRDGRLVVEARAYAPALPVQVDVLLNDHPVGYFRPNEGWNSYEIALPVSLFAEAQSVIEFRFDRTARPSQHEAGSADERQISVRFDRVAIMRE
jgi:phosphatidylinositol glycan class B